ncbi:MAG: transcriptional regulator NrdR [Actinomycetota bacterium]
MRCPICGAEETRVIDSRPAEQGGSIRRRRSCAECGHRFTTYERGAPVLLVRKRSGRLEPFSPLKLQKGGAAALADRPVLGETLNEFLDEVEASTAAHGGPMPSKDIGKMVLDWLRGADEVAYLRFASVYKGFSGAEDFGREVAALEKVGSANQPGTDL